MNEISFGSFADVGVADKERLVLNIKEDLMIGDYAMFATRKPSKSVLAGRQKAAFWFPDVELKAGDVVVVYTKAGPRKQKDLGEGKTAQFFYWGLPEPIWADAERCLVLLKVESWESQLPQSVIEE